jgi:hypothetical protein
VDVWYTRPAQGIMSAIKVLVSGLSALVSP